MAWINYTRLRRVLRKIPVLAGLTLVSLNLHGADYPVLNDAQTEWLGEQIFRNECNLRLSCLTAWNAGENFPSLGIGHFIWYRQGQEEIFEESFPALMRYLQGAGHAIPSWIITENYEQPWPGRDAFLADMDEERLVELRDFLAATKGSQTAFIVRRFESALTEILETVDDADTARIIAGNFYSVASSAPPYGLYALIDYVNFKGAGVSPQESWRGQGWGLKQVLLEMAKEDIGNTAGSQDALARFVASARIVLDRRVSNAPAGRDEARWLTGWNSRLDTYLPGQR